MDRSPTEAPLVITTIAPDPIPVTGTDDKIHVAYELSVLNSGPRPATITRVQTLADGPEGAPVATIGQQDTVDRWRGPHQRGVADRDRAATRRERLGGRQRVLRRHVAPRSHDGRGRQDERQRASATVKVGDKVTRGQVIGRLGNSGNTTEAHLHFHVSRSPVPLSSDNVAYEIDQFAFAGTIDGDDVAQEPTASGRTNQKPLDGSVIDFPAAP